MQFQGKQELLVLLERMGIPPEVVQKVTTNVKEDVFGEVVKTPSGLQITGMSLRLKGEGPSHNMPHSPINPRDIFGLGDVDIKDIMFGRGDEMEELFARGPKQHRMNLGEILGRGNSGHTINAFGELNKPAGPFRIRKDSEVPAFSLGEMLAMAGRGRGIPLDLLLKAETHNPPSGKKPPMFPPSFLRGMRPEGLDEDVLFAGMSASDYLQAMRFIEQQDPNQMVEMGPEEVPASVIKLLRNSMKMSGKRDETLDHLAEHQESLLSKLSMCWRLAPPEAIIYLGGNGSSKYTIVLGKNYPRPKGMSEERMDQIMHTLRANFPREFATGSTAVICLGSDVRENLSVFKELTEDCALNSLEDLSPEIREEIHIADFMEGRCPCLEGRLKEFFKHSAMDNSKEDLLPDLFVIAAGRAIPVGREHGPTSDPSVNNMIKDLLITQFKSLLTSAPEKRILQFGAHTSLMDMPPDAQKIFCPECPCGCSGVRRGWIRKHEGDHPADFAAITLIKEISPLILEILKD